MEDWLETCRAAAEDVQRVLGAAELRSYPATPDAHHSYAGGLLEHTVGVATICREVAQLHPRLRADLVLAAALLHDVGRTLELGRGPVFRQTEEGRLLGHVQKLGVRPRLKGAPKSSRVCRFTSVGGPRLPA